MNYPLMDEYEALKRKYTVIPIMKEIEGDMETPISLFKKLCNDKNTFLLESVEGGDKWGRYSFIGRKPYMTIIGKNNTLTVKYKDNTHSTQGKYIDEIKKIFQKYTMPKLLDYPDFLGGAVGYIGYDSIRDYETLNNVNVDDIDIPEVHLMIMEEIIVYDHKRQRILIVINNFVTEDNPKGYLQCIDQLEEIEEEINIPIKENQGSYKNYPVKFTGNETMESYMNKVKKAKEYIRNGDIFQVVLSQRLQVETEVNPLEFYRTLRSMNPSPYMYYIEYGDYQIVGSSPELLVKLKDGMIETCPIAGTRPRGNNEEEDKILREELLNDEKEKAEHLMLVDLARNDIGKLSEFGSVKVNQFMEVQQYSHVMHIVTTVVGKIHGEYDMFDVLISALPAGTVSGAPKVRAMEIIDELEDVKRGMYAGSIGYFGFNGNMDMCITIRTILFKDNMAYVQAGAGIVADSDPEKEYLETMGKAKALVEAMIKTGERMQ